MRRDVFSRVYSDVSGVLGRDGFHLQVTGADKMSLHVPSDTVPGVPEIIVESASPDIIVTECQRQLATVLL